MRSRIITRYDVYILLCRMTTLTPSHRCPIAAKRIAYVGEVHFATGEHVGLELEEPVGTCNGTIGGTAYFACDELVWI